MNEEVVPQLEVFLHQRLRRAGERIEQGFVNESGEAASVTVEEGAVEEHGEDLDLLA